MQRIVKLVLVGLTATAVITSAAFAARPAKKDPPCSINPNPVSVGQTYVVSASGLPIGTAVNLWVSDPSGKTWGSPLGSTPDGSFNLNESSSSAGTWTYVFSGPAKNNNTTVYSSCSVNAS